MAPHGRVMVAWSAVSDSARPACHIRPTRLLSRHDAVRPVTRYGSPARARAAALLMPALPGSAHLYPGEELGLPPAEVPVDRVLDPLWGRSGRTERGRDGARVPRPWS